MTCPKCGKAVKYIASSFQNIFMCELEKQSLITESGRMVSGYLAHVCSGPERFNTDVTQPDSAAEKK